MKIQKTLALAAATLALGVPVAAAAPDGYQPQLQSSAQPDAVDRYLANNGPDGFQPQLQSNAQPDAVDRYVGNALRQADQPDAIARYLRNNPSGATSALDSTGAAGHPDSLAVRPSVNVPVAQAETEGFSWETGALGALGGALIVLLGIVGASTMRERRRLVLR